MLFFECVKFGRVCYYTPMPLKLYNTLTRTIQPLTPLKGREVRVYSCGPTVYWFAHIGNFRSFLLSDFLHRVLRFDGYKVKLVMNITDVGHLTSDADTGEDKMEKAAAASGKSAWDIASAYTDAFHQDRDALNILPPAVECRATDHIKEQIVLVRALERKGFTYTTSDGLYFDTSKFKEYGKLSRQKLSDKKGGARVAKGLGEKRNITDFALWKFSPRSKSEKRQMEWESPWGVGFPGWHLECSAMSTKYLGQPFDIHTGGIDHLAVHHENEIAQSEAATGKPLARFWLHGEFLVFGKPNDEVRMGKSLDNIMTIADLQKEGTDPLAYRYLCVSTHYRSKLFFSKESLKAAAQGLRRMREMVLVLPRPARHGATSYEERFAAAINNDLNLPKALAVVWELLRSRVNPAEKRRSMIKFDQVLGLDLDKASEVEQISIPADVAKLVAAREGARKRKEWGKADELRKQIAKLGYSVKDEAGHSVVLPTN